FLYIRTTRSEMITGCLVSARALFDQANPISSHHKSNEDKKGLPLAPLPILPVILSCDLFVCFLLFSCFRCSLFLYHNTMRNITLLVNAQYHIDNKNNSYLK